MFIIKFIQKENSKNFGIFETEKEAIDFIEKIPNVIIENYEYYNSYFIEENKMRPIEKISIGNNEILLSKFMFEQDSTIEIEIEELPLLSKNEWKNFTTKVDAYSVNNDELEKYITLREQNYIELKKEWESKGYKVTREYRDSIDGEAITLEKDGETQFYTHMDPSFVYEK